MAPRKHHGEEYVYVVIPADIDDKSKPLSGEMIYKVGHTVAGKSRISDYGSGSTLLLQMRCYDSLECERNILTELRNSESIGQHSRGKEYFVGAEEVLLEIVTNHAIATLRPPSTKQLLSELNCEAIVLTELQPCYQGWILSDKGWEQYSNIDRELNCRFNSLSAKIKRHGINVEKLLGTPEKSVVDFNNGITIGGAPITSGIYYSSMSVADICSNPECKLRAMYALQGESRGRYCATHKVQGMVNLFRASCHDKECSVVALFGILGEEPVACARHKSDEMVKYPRKRCITKCCSSVATHLKDGVRTHCDEHAEPGEVGMRVGSLCKSAESDIRSLLREKNIKYEENWGNDTCRPSVVMLYKGWATVIQVEGAPHSNYTPTMLRNLIGVPTVLIYYNPDEFQGGVVSQQDRYNILMTWVCYCSVIVPTHQLSQLRLFYDNYSPVKGICQISCESRC